MKMHFYESLETLTILYAFAYSGCVQITYEQDFMLFDDLTCLFYATTWIHLMSVSYQSSSSCVAENYAKYTLFCISKVLLSLVE